ncbi:phage virion morphogenesis protein [Ursidibacter sp. B-7004-1]
MASDDMLQVKAAFDGLLQNISKSRRHLLYQQIGRELARSQRRRIKAQQNPDGTAFAPRKPQKSRKGSIKQQAMFRKIATPRFMKLRRTAEGIELGYSGSDANIANVHQYGLRARVNRRADWKVKYEQRELLGFSDEDIQMIEDLVIKALADGT